MTEQIIVHLDRVKKWRGPTEWRWQNVARSGRYEVAGDGRVIEAICREMARDGWDGDVVVMRGETMCFDPAPLHVWASGKFGRGEQPEQLRKVTQ